MTSFPIWTTSSTTPPPQIDKPERAELFDIKPGSVLILDTLKASNDADENKATDMKPIFDFLKQLRTHGLTIIVLHHTSKGPDGNYRGSTVIQDQSDHCISLTKVKAPGSEQEIGDDDDSATYRLGTRGKTRARPFKMFLEFDQQTELFKAVADPDDAAMQNILAAIKRITEKNSIECNQSNMVLSMKSDLDTPLSEGKTKTLLKRGEGRFWESHRGKNNALLYRPKSGLAVLQSYIGAQNHKTEIPFLPTDEKLPDESDTQTVINNGFDGFSGGNYKTAKLVSNSVMYVDSPLEGLDGFCSSDEQIPDLDF